MKRHSVAAALSAVLTAGATVLVLASCGGSKKESAVRILYQTGNLCGAPVHVAMANGLFEEEFKAIGQKYEFVQLVSDGPTTGELIASGKVDAGYGLLATQLQPMENGLPIAFTTGIHTGCTKYYAKPGSGITSVADLRGKKIGIPGLADSSVMNIKRKLNDEGIGVTEQDIEVEFLVYSSSDLPIALDKGAVDAIGLHDPVATKGEQEYGFIKILDTGIDPKFVNEYCCQAFVTLDLANKNPKAAAAYTRAMQKAAAFVKANPREAAQIQLDNNYVSGDIDFNSALLASYDFTPSRELGQQTFISAATQLQKIGLLKESTDLQKFLKRGYYTLDGVPESYVYNNATKAFTASDRR